MIRAKRVFHQYRAWSVAFVAFNLSFNCIGAEAAGSQKPKVGTYAVGLPFFRIKDEQDICAGKIFCVELKNGKKVLVTALHLIGPASGAAKQFTAAQCAGRIRKVDVFPTSAVGKTKPIAIGLKQLLTAGDLSRVDSKDLRGDLLAFSVDDKCQLTPFKISSKQPAVNTAAYIVSSASDNKQDVFEGTITNSTNKYLTIKLKKPILLPRVSGAPVIDSNGIVVGMVYGTNDNATYFLNPGPSIYLRLTIEVSHTGN
jgi:hypothetical protein